MRRSKLGGCQGADKLDNEAQTTAFFRLGLCNDSCGDDPRKRKGITNL